MPQSNNRSDSKPSLPTSAVRLEGKVVLVTGASTGIGAGLVKALAERGALVVGVGRRLHPGRELQRELKGQGLEFTFISGDVTSSADCDAVVAAAIARHGHLDVLVNNAGMSLPNHRIEETSDEDWEAVVGVTLQGVAKMTRAVLPGMQARKRGSILNIASVTAVHGIERMGAYGAAKAGVLSLTRVTAIENLKHNITANAVVMGSVATPQSAQSLIDIGRSLHGPDWMPDAALIESVESMLMQPADVAPALALLCSDDAHEINGSIISIDRCHSAGLMTSTMLYMGAAGMLPAMN